MKKVSDAEKIEKIMKQIEKCNSEWEKLEKMFGKVGVTPICNPFCTDVYDGLKVQIYRGIDALEPFGEIVTDGVSDGYVKKHVTIGNVTMVELDGVC